MLGKVTLDGLSFFPENKGWVNFPGVSCCHLLSVIHYSLINRSTDIDQWRMTS